MRTYIKKNGNIFSEDYFHSVRSPRALSIKYKKLNKNNYERYIWYI